MRPVGIHALPDSYRNRCYIGASDNMCRNLYRKELKFWRKKDFEYTATNDADIDDDITCITYDGNGSPRDMDFR